MSEIEKLNKRILSELERAKESISAIGKRVSAVSMKLIPKGLIDDPIPGQDAYNVYSSRSRLREEFSQAIFDLMEYHSISSLKLAEMLCKDKEYVNKLLSGSGEISIDEISDAFLVFGRTPHFVLGDDPNQMRLAVDEVSLKDKKKPAKKKTLKKS